MIISLNWLKKYASIDLPVQDLAVLIGSRLVEVEEVIDLGKRYEGIVIGEIKQTKKHPAADKLNMYQLDDGGMTKDVPRLKNGLVQVVSGDKDLKVGDKVAWLSPGSSVPSSFDTAEPLTLGSREMRGQTSHGMFGSGLELGVNSDSGRVLRLDTSETIGTPFAKAYELDDYLLDIENKSLTHRPDAFGLVGFAREVSAISGQTFTTPEWLLSLKPILAKLNVEPLEITAKVEDKTASPRYELVAIKDIKNKKSSPILIQSYLQRVGLRPISPVVDITNYLMYIAGQPLHAFDYEKVVAEHPAGKAEIIVRLSKQGEKLKLLDGRTIVLSDKDIIICAGSKPIGLAGAMGGSSTEIDQRTTSILLEAATFDLYRLRATGMRHGIFSEAVTRFTKGQPAALTAPTLASAIRMVCDSAGGERASEIIDTNPAPPLPGTINLNADHTNKLLGTKLDVEEIVETLARVEIEAKLHRNMSLNVQPPYWRADLNIAEDIIEEVGRLRGYDNIPVSMPARSLRAVDVSDYDKMRHSIRNTLSAAGANEVLTYSFVPGKLLTAAAQDTKPAFKIINALSPELEYYRLSLTPSLLEKIRLNTKAGYDELALYELNKTHSKEYGSDTGGVPKEVSKLGLVFASKTKTTHENGSPFYFARKYLDFLAGKHNLGLDYKPLSDREAKSQAIKPFDAGRSALVFARDSNTFLGVIGEYKSSVKKNLKLPNFCAGFEINLDELFKVLPKTNSYTSLSRFPGTERDICFKTPMGVTYAELESIVRDILAKSSLETELSPIDIYSRDDDKRHTQITIRIKMTDHNHTIDASEANKLVADITEAAKKIGAKVI